LSVVSIVCCQVEVSATDLPLIKRSPTDCGSSFCVIKKPLPRGGYSPVRGPQNTNPQWVVAPVEEKIKCVLCHRGMARPEVTIRPPETDDTWKYDELSATDSQRGTVAHLRNLDCANNN